MSNTMSVPERPQACQKICCKAFFSHEDLPLTEAPSLANPISALFSESQFKPKADLEDREYFPKFSYAALEPALRLASRFLTLDSVVRLIVVMADGDLRVEDEHGHFQATTWEEVDASLAKKPNGDYSPPSRHPKPEHEVVGDTMRRRAEEILTQAIPLFEIDIYTSTGEGSSTTTDVGRGSLPPGVLVPTLPHSRRCTIAIDADLFYLIDYATRYLALEAEFGPRPDYPYRARTSLSFNTFRFAIALVHELFHVLERAYNGISVVETAVRGHSAGSAGGWAVGKETFYGHSAVSECGYEVENAIFGGVPTALVVGRAEMDSASFCAKAVEREGQHRQHFAYRLALVPWPSYALFRSYEKRGYISMGLRRGHKGPTVDGLDRIDVKFVEHVLSERFWAAGVGPGPLILPKVGKTGRTWCGRMKAARFTKISR